jgi:ankyrin repeat protein
VLHLAAERGNWNAVKWLVEHGKANADAIDKNGNTQLDLAEKQKHKEIAGYLKKDGRIRRASWHRIGYYTGCTHC